MAPRWLTACAADVPAGDAWLSAAERHVQSGLRIEKRRADWRLGRWTAKQADDTVAAVAITAAVTSAAIRRERRWCPVVVLRGVMTDVSRICEGAPVTGSLRMFVCRSGIW